VPKDPILDEVPEMTCYGDDIEAKTQAEELVMERRPVRKTC
jgi:hypothetical protein